MNAERLFRYSWRALAVAAVALPPVASAPPASAGQCSDWVPVLRKLECRGPNPLIGLLYLTYDNWRGCTDSETGEYFWWEIGGSTTVPTGIICVKMPIEEAPGNP